jgi:hypothetical protein
MGFLAGFFFLISFFLFTTLFLITALLRAAIFVLTTFLLLIIFFGFWRTSQRIIPRDMARSKNAIPFINQELSILFAFTESQRTFESELIKG